MPTSEPVSEYAEFYLVNPELIEANGRDGAITMVIGAYFNDSFIIDLTGSQRQQARTVNRNIADLRHSKTGRNQLHRRAVRHGTWVFYFCSFCGHYLSPTSCPGCSRQYASDETSLGGKPFIIPPKIVRYAKAQGHTFEKEPPRC